MFFRATHDFVVAAAVYLALPSSVLASEDEYLVGDWDHDGRDNLAVRRENCVVKDYDFDGVQNAVQCYGSGNHARQYLVGDWDGDGDDNLAFRVMDQIYFDTSDDAHFESWMFLGEGHKEAEYFSGDWDGDGRDDLATRKGICIWMDYGRDGDYDRIICVDTGGHMPDEYLVGDWDGMWGDSFAIREDGCVYMDRDGDGLLELDTPQCYGFGNGEDQYLVGDWDGDGSDNLAVRRGNVVLMDTNGDWMHDIEQMYGQGVEVLAQSVHAPPTPNCHWFWAPPQQPPFITLDSYALQTTVLRAIGNNATDPVTRIGIRGAEAQAWGLLIEDDPTIGSFQTRIVYNNLSGWDNYFTTGVCNDGQRAPARRLVPADQSLSVVVDLQDLNTIVLDDVTCTSQWICQRRPAVAFSTSTFGSFAAGRKLTFRYLRQ